MDSRRAAVSPAAEEARAAAAVRAVGEERRHRALTAADLAAYAGTYVSEELLDVRYVVSVVKDSLMLETRTIKPTQLKAMAPDKFALPEYGFNAELTRDKDGKIRGVSVSAGRAAGIEFVRK